MRTLKRDYVRVSPVPDTESVLRQLPDWLAHYNELHPHRALGYRSPREFIVPLQRLHERLRDAVRLGRAHGREGEAQAKRGGGLASRLGDVGAAVARETRAFAREIGLEPRTTPLESPQSDGMAEAFVCTIKRDYVWVSPLPDAQAVLRQLPGWLAHYNAAHPHKALGHRSPREFIAARFTP